MPTQNITAKQNEATVIDEPSSCSFGETTQHRACAGSCGQAIPTKRLLARPNALMCVPCQEAAGDVLVIRRFDEFDVDGNLLETYFSDTPAPLLSRHIQRSNVVVPDDLSFDYAVGDDSHLIREGNSVMDVARPLASEFEDGPWEVVVTDQELLAAS
jgi:hypothetical protein